MDRSAFEAEAEKALSPAGRGAVFLAAVSGGADSVSLLAALEAVRGRNDWSVHCLHVNHNIRPGGECLADQSFVEDLCAKWDIPFHLEVVPPGAVKAGSSGCGLEAAARSFRIRAYRRWARKIAASGVLTAHTADDALENLLMAVLRGAGPGGLAKMPCRAGLVIRPLLGLARKDVLAYLESRGLPHREDPSNLDLTFLRNRVRRKLIPVLDEFFPSWRQNLNSLGETQALVRDFVGEEAALRIPWRIEQSGLSAEEAAFFGAPMILREEALFQAVDAGALLPSSRRSPLAPDLPRKHRQPRRAALRAFASGVSKGLCLGDTFIEKTCGRVYIRKRAAGASSLAFVIAGPGAYDICGLRLEVRDDGSAMGLEKKEEGFILYASNFPLVIRSLKAGEKLPPISGALHASGKPRPPAEANTGIMVIEHQNGMLPFPGD